MGEFAESMEIVTQSFKQPLICTSSVCLQTYVRDSTNSTKRMKGYMYFVFPYIVHDPHP